MELDAETSALARSCAARAILARRLAVWALPNSSPQACGPVTVERKKRVTAQYWSRLLSSPMADLQAQHDTVTALQSAGRSDRILGCSQISCGVIQGVRR